MVKVKSTRTPETPRPASDKQTDKDADDVSRGIIIYTDYCIHGVPELAKKYM